MPCEKWQKTVQKEDLHRKRLHEELFERYLDTHGIPDPDLLIRTSGELRLVQLSCYGSLLMQNFILQMFRGRILQKKNLEKAIEAI